MILGAAPVFAEEEVKVEETKEINYKEAYLQNVVAAKEAAVKEAEAKLEAAKKAVEQDIDVVLTATALKTAKEDLKKAEETLAKTLKEVDEKGQELLKKFLGEGTPNLADSKVSAAYTALVTKEAAVKVAQATYDAKVADTKAKKGLYDAKVNKGEDATTEFTNWTKAITDEADALKGLNTAKAEAKEAKTKYDEKVNAGKGDGSVKEELYKLTHQYPGYFEAYYNVDAKKLAVVEANAKYEAVLKASPKNAGVVEATAALEAAKAELEAAKAELNAAKAGVEEKPEVVVDWTINHIHLLTY